jgi:hypothetical protein
VLPGANDAPRSSILAHYYPSSHGAAVCLGDDGPYAQGIYLRSEAN